MIIRKMMLMLLMMIITPSILVLASTITITMHPVFPDSSGILEKMVYGATTAWGDAEAHAQNEDDDDEDAILHEEVERALPTYIVRMMPGAAEDDPTHYNPHKIAVPAGITVAWINNDQGTWHTVTSGNPSNEESGSLFNSGPMPFRQDFKLTFDRVGGLGAGEIPYYCKIHPWLRGSVLVNDTVVRGDSFEMAAGTGPVLNLTENSRTLLEFRPTAAALPSSLAPPDTTLSYNFTIVRNEDNQTVFEDTFQVEDNDFEVELVQKSMVAVDPMQEGKQGLDDDAPAAPLSPLSPTAITTAVVYGPDFSNEYTGAYHVLGDIVGEPGEYTIIVEIIKIGLHHPLEQIGDVFQLKVVS